MMQPSRWARWPTTHSSPTVVCCMGVVWITQPSWIEVRAPMMIGASSARSTAPGQIELSAPMVTEPITTASGET